MPGRRNTGSLGGCSQSSVRLQPETTQASQPRQPRTFSEHSPDVTRGARWRGYVRAAHSRTFIERIWWYRTMVTPDHGWIAPFVPIRYGRHARGCRTSIVIGCTAGPSNETQIQAEKDSDGGEERQQPHLISERRRRIREGVAHCYRFAVSVPVTGLGQALLPLLRRYGLQGR